MFFILSKIAWSFIMPMNFIMLIACCAGAFWVFKKRFLAKILLIISFSLFLIIGYTPVGYNALVLMEKQYQRPAIMPQHVDGIIVLGGSFDSKSYEKTGMISATAQVNRIIDYIDLAQRYPKAKLVFSGGSGLLKPTKRVEADDIALFFNMIAFDDDRVIYERQSRNSYENLLYSKALLNPDPDETWLVVTSRYHMPRVMGIAKQLEWALTPYPSSPFTYGQYRLRAPVFNVLSNFHYTHTAVKEFVGSVVYALTGRSAFLLPFGRDT